MFLCMPFRSFFSLCALNMPPTTTTSTHCSHCTVQFCVLVLLMLLSGYHCQDICVNEPDLVQCITDLNDIEIGHGNASENCIRIEGIYNSHVYMYMCVCMQCICTCTLCVQCVCNMNYFVTRTICSKDEDAKYSLNNMHENNEAEMHVYTCKKKTCCGIQFLMLLLTIYCVWTWNRAEDKAKIMEWQKKTCKFPSVYQYLLLPSYRVGRFCYHCCFWEQNICSSVLFYFVHLFIMYNCG